MNFKILLTLEYLLLLTGCDERGKKRAICNKRGCGKNRLDNCVCGRTIENRIIGGIQSDPHGFPWQVGFSKLQKELFFCGGSLISIFHAVTAAHCFVSLQNELYNIRVILGVHDYFQMTAVKQERRISEVKIHPGYKPSQIYNDVAIIKFSTPVKFNPFITPICFPPPGKNYIGEMATVVGWGRLRQDGPFSSILMKVEVPVRQDPICYSKLGITKLNPNQICAFYDEGGKDSCEGDSGSPLMIKDGVKWFIIGIVSIGWGCARPMTPALYTRIDRYYKWIKTTAVGASVCL